MDRQAHLVDDSIGLPSLAIVGSIFGVSVILYMLRIYIRVIPRYQLNGSDYCASCALVAEAITFSFFAAAVAFGLGRHSVFVSPEDGASILRCLFAIAVAGLWASALARISIACLLLTLSTCNSGARIILWSMIVLQVGALIVTETITLLQCRPIQAIWEDVPDAQCLSIKTLQVGGYLYTGVGIAGDLVFAIMPIALIWNLNRSILERCLVSFLLASGLFASAAAVTRLFYVKTFDYNSSDIFRDIMPTFFWCRIEEVALIAASSLPFLKASTEHQLRKLGFPGFRNTHTTLQPYYSQSPSSKSRRCKFIVREERVCESGETDWDVEAGGTTSGGMTGSH
ncbi:hypothetical protein BN1723_000904 [Verticillium longisporum]|uniref:Rhodopsin domain-containing protein n=1 Tax=Verticillium longisporum TaxID=100787 RepID=A0A0G4NCQ9_VERLO|nr:hypothetical protein BN1708_013789 [Verticillium longisporum]CRK44218.1 hypothetical protein BN1723_000904 [Verticillium longisporum]